MTQVLDLFMKGEHVMRHIPKIWNGIWCDMYIETTFVRYGQGIMNIVNGRVGPATGGSL